MRAGGLDAGLALLLWGLWAFFPKLAQARLGDAFSGVLYQYLGSLVGVGVLIVARGHAAPTWEPRGALYAGLAGLAATLGMLFYYRACATLNVSLVAAVTALYPVIVVGLAWPLLGEALSPRQWLGVGMALGAAVLLAPSA